MATVIEQREATGLTVERGQEVVVRRKNDIGILFEIATLLSEKGVNILGVSAGVCGEDCLIRLVTDDNRKSKDVLAANNFAPEEENVVLAALPHRPGMLKHVTRTLAQEGIDIRHIYAAADRGQEHCVLVFHSSDDEVALAKLKEIQTVSSAGGNAAGTGKAEQDANANMIAEGGPAY